MLSTLREAANQVEQEERESAQLELLQQTTKDKDLAPSVAPVQTESLEKHSEEKSDNIINTK